MKNQWMKIKKTNKQTKKHSLLVVRRVGRRPRHLAGHAQTKREKKLQTTNKTCPNWYGYKKSNQTRSVTLATKVTVWEKKRQQKTR